MNAGQAARSFYAKICALIILTYVVLMCIVGFISLPTIDGLRTGLAVGMMFGIPAGLLLGGVPAILYYYHRKAFQGKVKHEDDITTHPSRTVDVDLPINEVFSLIEISLPLLTLPPNAPGVGLFGKVNWQLHQTSANRDKGVLITWLRRRWNFYNTSRITIHLERIDDNTTRVNIRSEPQWSFFVFDYGLNMHNVVMLAQHIREQAHLKTAASHLQEKSFDTDKPLVERSTEDTVSTLSIFKQHNIK